MSGNARDETLSQLTLFVEDSRVRMYQLPDAARDWLESEAGFGSSSIAFSQNLNRDGLLSKTSPACYPATEGKTLPSSFAGWSSAGMASPGGYLTLSISDCPSAAVVCSLSEVLETDVPRRYFLSARAARGILRRAEKRGREMPTVLRAALQQAAESMNPEGE